MNFKKREVREFCFQYFFHLQLPVFNELRKSLSNTKASEEILESIAEFKESTNTLLSEEHSKYVVQSICGTLKHYDELETIITKNLKNWKLERLSKVDHTILLLSTYELVIDKETPSSVVINEAIEISKKYGSSESSSFINGILDSISKG